MDWNQPPFELVLQPNEIHLWLADLDCAKTHLAHFQALLSADERQRADRLYQEKHRQRFTLARGILRTILSRYLHRKPEELQFRYEPRGKPVLVTASDDRTLNFNLSHAHEMALFAVTGDCPVGVDLEYLRTVADIEQLAQRFFSARESLVLQGLPDAQKQAAFFRYWTCKEAYLKATGAGIAHLDRAEILLSPSQPARLLQPNSLTGDRDWRLLEFTPAPNYVSAIAWAGDCQFQYWQFDE